MKVLILGGGMLGHKLWQSYHDRFDTWVTVRSSYPDYACYELFVPLDDSRREALRFYRQIMSFCRQFDPVIARRSEQIGRLPSQDPDRRRPS